MFTPGTRRLARNLFSSSAYVGLMALFTLFAVPVYARTLGPAQWGNVAFCIAFQGLLFSLDIALGPLMLRDVARAAVTGRQQSTYRRFLRYYGVPALMVSAAGLLASLVLEQWRRAAGDPLSPDLVWTMRLALVQFLFQFSNNAAIGFWNGQQEQHYANTRLACFALAKNALALLLLTQWMASAPVYMLPFALVSALEFALNYRLVTREQHDAVPVPVLAEAVANRRDAAGFAAAALLGIATSQIDRIYLAFALPVERFGVYILVSTLILSLLSLQMPIQRVFLPRVATSVSPRRAAMAMLGVTCALIVLPSLAMAAVPELVLRLWLHDPAIAAAGAPPFRLMLVAVALIALYSPCSALLVHYHRNKTMAVVSGAALCAQLLVLITLTRTLDMTAGAIAWLACGLIQAVSAGVIWRQGAPDVRT